MPPSRLTRRDFLRAGSVAVGAVAAAGCVPPPAAAPPSTTPSWQPPEFPPLGPTRTPSPAPASEIFAPKHVLRIAHLTDMHVYPETRAQEGFARAIRHAQRLSPAPDLILNTGDSVMETLSAGKDDALAQWGAFREVLEREASIPVVHSIGNHDVWGWGLADPGVRSDPLYGKAMAVRQLELEAPFYGFDRAGWHFVVLDSTHPPIVSGSGFPYSGKLDDEQFAWLEADVDSVSPQTPICIVSHIPIVAACEYFDGPNEESGNWVVPGAWMHIDARRFRTLFLAHPNIRLCLSGHTHQHERLDYLGVRYLTNGAVSGNWWGGIYMDFPPAYVVVDLFADGSSEHSFVEYDA